LFNRPILANSFLVLISALVGLGMAELAARWIIRAAPFEVPIARPAYLTAKDNNLRWRFSAEGGRNDLGRGVLPNSLGLRNREILPKEPSQRRILFWEIR
jgi:hypothetical protein